MVKCKDCWFRDYIKTGYAHGYDICVLYDRPKVDKNIERNCKDFKPNLMVIE